MQQVFTNLELQTALADRASSSLALVPTMGNIHRGHLELVKSASQQADRTAVSIFVNPTQFNQADDYQHYPRTLDADLEQLAAAGVDLVFTPDVEQLYPHATLRAQVEATVAATGLEGAHRPGHFRGVATIVCKLFNLFQPTIALFGKKDYQQLAVIRAMVEELFLPVVLGAEETVREADMVAMSSRNSRLTAGQRQIAPLMYATLQSLADQIPAASDYSSLEQSATATLNDAGFKVDYVAIRDRYLQLPNQQTRELVILAAAELGNVRLIDNLEIEH
ncbi:MAG: pantoate--beta-alanine ligase [Immundisolibacteraceae bacterium]|nr:pantoate--beta-alanine ligase [Immundisolibacteraceae bacterium]